LLFEEYKAGQGRVTAGIETQTLATSMVMNVEYWQFHFYSLI